MNRDQLKAVIRRQLTRITALALDGDAATAELNQATDVILQAADTYRGTWQPPAPSGLTPTQQLVIAERRQALGTPGDRP